MITIYIYFSKHRYFIFNMYSVLHYLFSSSKSIIVGRSFLILGSRFPVGFPVPFVSFLYSRPRDSTGLIKGSFQFKKVSLASLFGSPSSNKAAALDKAMGVSKR